MPDASGVGGARTFNAAHWAPTVREYGVLYLLMLREHLMEQMAKEPAEEEKKHLRCMGQHVISAAMAAKAEAEHSQDDDSGSSISEGEPHEPTDPASSWNGKRGAWWRVVQTLGEDVLVREGVSLLSPELRRASPGDLVLQAGAARSIREGRARGCIRVPVVPSGWVTADARPAGGPLYLVHVPTPRWRVVYTSSTSKEGDVIVRADTPLDSEEVTVLWSGDIVDQAGPLLTRTDGIIRMPITPHVTRRPADGEADLENGNRVERVSCKVLGWVTIDASEAGGPVFFKAVAENDNKKRRNRRNWS
eukprot:gnl/TRDRNA2_/TRDRNA2_192423_c0_seq1.p1 gnl/TRDRNA2_/TRDRNA2_192423_c0~~gnl/TRDRNA2_/TRDRNA2_192423_c0_seq1.p1  ORF type:complete len:322 (-),score=33.81 gnl/TRDRNA2_/TRDRNA2_192423_c0_seq1:186-1100(-)